MSRPNHVNAQAEMLMALCRLGADVEASKLDSFEEQHGLQVQDLKVRQVPVRSLQLGVRTLLTEMLLLCLNRSCWRHVGGSRRQ